MVCPCLSSAARIILRKLSSLSSWQLTLMARAHWPMVSRVSRWNKSLTSTSAAPVRAVVSPSSPIMVRIVLPMMPDIFLILAAVKVVASTPLQR